MSNDLTLFNFQKELSLSLDRILPDHTHTKIQDKLKNNGVRLHGICIMDPASNVSPIFYVDPYYEQFQSGRGLDDIAEEICVRYNECVFITAETFEDFENYERIRNRIVYRVINTELNKEKLSNAPHIPFLDLSIVFYAVMNECGQTGEVMIDNSHLDVWENVDTAILMQDAVKNTPEIFPYKLCGLLDQCLDLTDPAHSELSLTNEDLIEHIFRTPDIEKDPAECMLILTTATLAAGACTLLYDSVLARIAEAFDSDLIIIPSSVNELILLPKSNVASIEGINETVREVNASHVDPVDILSSHVYQFQRSKQCVTY